MIFAVQLIILAFCIVAVSFLIARFPYPSPLISWLLPPKKRWPTEQIRSWIESGNVDDGFLAFFQRDPERTVPGDAAIVSPADGTVTEIGLVGENRYLVIALNFWDVHVQRSPVEGVVSSVADKGDAFTDGEGRQQAFLRDKQCPVQKIVDIETRWGMFRVRLITSYLARRIEVWKQPGEKVEMGERLGRILLGSTVVLEIPGSLSVEVHTGQTVVAGETVVTRMERSPE